MSPLASDLLAIVEIPVLSSATFACPFVVVSNINSPSVDATLRGYTTAVSATSKATYKVLSIATSVAGGLLAGAVFNQIWKRIGDDEETPPDPKDLNRSWREALTAAALQGLTFGLVRAAVDRATARGYQAVTHENPA
jgi:hypothetical protein